METNEHLHPARQTDEAARARGKIGWEDHRRLRRLGARWGLVAAALLVLVYLGVLALANSLEHAVDEFLRLWPWMTALILGFSLQVGLFAYARAATRGAHRARAGGVAASGGTSTVSMIACCAHHLTDVLPAIGLAGASVFLATYQSLFLLLGVLSNAVGLTYVLGLFRKHGLFPDRPSVLSATAGWPLDHALPVVLGLCTIIFLAAVALAFL